MIRNNTNKQTVIELFGLYSIAVFTWIEEYMRNRMPGLMPCYADEVMMSCWGTLDLYLFL